MPRTAPDLGVRRAGRDRRGRCRALVEAGLPQQRGAGQLDVLGLGCIATLDGPHQSSPHCGADFASSDAAQPDIHGRFQRRVGHLGGEIVCITLCHSLNQRDGRVARRHATTSGLRAFDTPGMLSTTNDTHKQSLWRCTTVSCALAPSIVTPLTSYYRTPVRVHKRMSRSRDVDPAVRLRKTARGWAEPSPTHCSECGATLGPRKVLVGVVTCLCGRSHRTHFCRACDFTHYTPALGPECLLLAMDERNMRATLRTDDDQASPP